MLKLQQNLHNINLCRFIHSPKEEARKGNLLCLVMKYKEQDIYALFVCSRWLDQHLT